MNLFIATDNYMADAMKPLAPHMNFFNDNEPRQLSDAASLPRPLVSTILTWYGAARVEPITQENMDFLASLT
jgi:hypothetical protein